MTQAICPNCGQFKFGCFTKCDNCGYEPKTEKEKDLSIVLSDHFIGIDELDEIGKKIQSGSSVSFGGDVIGSLD